MPLDPGREEVTAASAETLGFFREEGEKPGWKWGEEGSLACLNEGEALLCLLSALTAEKGNAGAKVGCQEIKISKCEHLTSSRELC